MPLPGEGQEPDSRQLVLIMEDQSLFRRGLALALGGAGFRVGELGVATLLSLELPGWEAASGRVAELELPVLGIAGQLSDRIVLSALSWGVTMCLERRQPAADFVVAVREAAAGKPLGHRTLVSHPGVALLVLRALSEPPARALCHLAPTSSHLERLALGRLGEGSPLKEVAGGVGVPEQEVARLLDSARRKLVKRRWLEGVLAWLL